MKNEKNKTKQNKQTNKQTKKLTTKRKKCVMAKKLFLKSAVKNKS